MSAETDIAGEGGTTPLPEMPEFGYRGRVGDRVSETYATRDEARLWVAQEKALQDGDALSSGIEMVEV